MTRFELFDLGEDKPLLHFSPYSSSFRAKKETKENFISFFHDFVGRIRPPFSSDWLGST